GQEQEAQRQRALEQAQAVAEEQQRRAEERTKAAKRLRRLLWSMVALAMIAVGASAVAVSKSNTAQKQTRLATVRQLAAQVLSRYVRLDLALLSSLEAIRIADTIDDDIVEARGRFAEARGSLLDGLQRSSNLIISLTRHTGTVRSVAFSPDGQTLASGSEDNTIILWDVASHQQLSALKGHTGTVRSVAFSPDGQTLASGSE